MSKHSAKYQSSEGSEGCIALAIEPRERDLGDFTVRRVLPASKRRMVGPFIFFDHMGPAEFPPGHGIQVRPHPHIGLATVTYLFDGEIMHRDSLGFVQAIRAGAVNLMTAGRGIVHSERAGEDFNSTSTLHGIQTWMALPTELEECEPAFVHYPAADLPDLDIAGVALRVIMGEAYGSRSPVTAHSPTLYLECRMPEGAELDLPDTYAELAAYVVSGEVRIDARVYGGGVMAVAQPDKSVRLTALKESHVMIIGGAAVGERHIEWNFVSSSKDRIAKAGADWQAGRFDSVPGDDEFIPLP